MFYCHNQYMNNFNVPKCSTFHKTTAVIIVSIGLGTSSTCQASLFPVKANKANC